MSEVLDTRRLKRAAEEAAQALAADDPKVRAGRFNPTPATAKAAKIITPRR